MSNNNAQHCCITAKDNFAILGLFFCYIPIIGFILSIIGLGAKGLKGVAIIGFILNALYTISIIIFVIMMIVDSSFLGNILSMFGWSGGL